MGMNTITITIMDTGMSMSINIMTRRSMRSTSMRILTLRRRGSTLPPHDHEHGDELGHAHQHLR